MQAQALPLPLWHTTRTGCLVSGHIRTSSSLGASVSVSCPLSICGSASLTRLRFLFLLSRTAWGSQQVLYAFKKIVNHNQQSLCFSRFYVSRHSPCCPTIHLQVSNPDGCLRLTLVPDDKPVSSPFDLRPTSPTIPPCVLLNSLKVQNG